MFCDNKPWRTSLCKMFWMFWFTTALLTLITGMTIGLLTILYLVAPFYYQGFVYTVIGLFAIAYYIAKWICEWHNTTVADTIDKVMRKLCHYEHGLIAKTAAKVETSLFWKMMKSIKAKTCPIIEVE